MQNVNVDGTRHVLEAAVDQGATTVHVSSVSALGPTGPSPVDEQWWSPNEPSVGYEATKREAHLLARAMAARGAPVRIGIPGGIYGYGDESSMAKLIEAFTSYPTPIGYMPELVQSLVNVDDCATGLRLIAEHAPDGGEFILCADAVPFREWFELIAYGAGRRPPIAYVPTSAVRWSSRPAAALTRWFRGNPDMVIDTVEIATRHQAFSGDKARSELGWAPRSLRQGMVEMCGAIRRDNDRKRVRATS
jgi:dihydroflavonol-4-reductase